MQKRTFAVYKRHEPALRLRPPLRPEFATSPSATANERFKTSFAPAFRLGFLVAISVHYAVMTAFPSLHAAETPVGASEVVAVALPPKVEIPRPPEAVARPAQPRIGALEVSDSLTIAPTTFEAFQPVSVEEGLPAPPVPIADERERPTYIPYEVAPRLKNPTEMIALLESSYPSSLRDAGIGGSVRLWILIDEEGIVRDAQVDVSSGFAALDEAARSVAYAMVFTPAMMRDRATPVWISQPIEFVTK